MNRLFIMLLIAGVLGVMSTILSADWAQAQEAPSASEEAKANSVQLVNGLHEGLLAIMKAGRATPFEDRMAKFRPAVNKSFDLRAVSGKTVGSKIWGELTDDQKTKYIDTFAEFLTASYADKFDSFNGHDFQVVSTLDAPRGFIFVKTHLIRPNNTPLQLDYLVGTRQDRQGIIDVFFDNVSEVARRQSEFKSIYYGSGFDALIALLESKILQMKTGMVELAPTAETSE